MPRLDRRSESNKREPVSEQTNRPAANPVRGPYVCRTAIRKTSHGSALPMLDGKSTLLGRKQSASTARSAV
jgi:hypothetical protein